MITVQEAEKIVLSQLKNYGTEEIPFEQALGRVLANDILADRDLPPFNRATVDGIAINSRAWLSGIYQFKIKATQAAGDAPLDIENTDECIEIMTGAALPTSVDTVIRYEDITIAGGVAQINIDDIKSGQNIHFKGTDKKQGDVLVEANSPITPAVAGIAGSAGKSLLQVKKLPRVAIITSGDELVEVDAEPSDYQIRRSNNYTVAAVLKQHGINADMKHIPDDPSITERELKYCLDNYDVLLLSGGISMGKFDYVPKALKDLQVQKLLHKVQQRPGKPFWFGSHKSGAIVFAFPGNPVATFMCLHKYFLSWLHASLGLPAQPVVYAVLDSDFTFAPNLTYYLQVKLAYDEQARLLAKPVEGNGSGDFANLADTDAFIELPSGRNKFTAGDIFRVIKF